MSTAKDFEAEKREAIQKMAADPHMRDLSKQWFDASCDHRYSYNFTWLGRPIIQYPQDILAVQEIIWNTKPDLVIETGVAHGGSLVLSASLLELLGGRRQVIGIDVDIRPHNRTAIEEHPQYRRISLIEGSSVAPEIIKQVRTVAREYSHPMVILDSNHTHEHVLEELRLYSPLVRTGGYLVVFDTVIEDMRPDAFPNRPWGVGNNPKTAVREFLRSNSRFVVDAEIEAKLQVTVAPGGYLRCIGD